MWGRRGDRPGHGIVITFLRMIPQNLHLLGFRVVLSFLLRKYPDFQKRLSRISGKTVLLEATDIRKRYPLRIREERIEVDLKGLDAPDVVMRGDFATLWKLFLRRVDADSLFFSRKLVVEGDVQTSVFLKNLLDSF